MIQLAAVAPSGPLVVLKPQLQEALARQQEGWAREVHRQQQGAAAMQEQLEQLQRWHLQQQQQHVGKKDKVSGFAVDAGLALHWGELLRMYEGTGGGLIEMLMEKSRCCRNGRRVQELGTN